jgi:hypothetical protein
LSARHHFRITGNGARSSSLGASARAITRSVKACGADRRLSVQPEPAETHTDNAATELVKLDRNPL